MARPKGICAWGKKSGGSWDYGGWQFVAEDGSAKQLAKLDGVDHQGLYDFDRVVKATGIEHWIRRGGYWIPDKKGTSTARPCCQPATDSSNSRWTHHGPCENPIKEDGMCGTHARKVKRAAEERASFTEARERGDAGRRIAQDAVSALQRRGYEAQVHYAPGERGKLGNYDGRVTIHAEDMLALLRRIEHLEGYAPV